MKAYSSEGGQQTPSATYHPYSEESESESHVDEALESLSAPSLNTIELDTSSKLQEDVCYLGNILVVAQILQPRELCCGRRSVWL